MGAYYFTYGRSTHHPFEGGWTKVKAEDRREAVRKFLMVHPPVEGLVPCCFIYPEEQFKDTEMPKTGNLGARTHEIIY